MSKNKGFSNTSANRYSLALYELAEESNLLSKIETNSLSILNLIGTSVDFNNLIKDPTVSRKELINAINKIFDYLEIENLLKNFTNFLVTKRRFFFIEQILNNFIEICSEKRGELKTEIRSAKNLSNDEINNIKDELSKYSGCVYALQGCPYVEDICHNINPPAISIQKKNYCYNSFL